MRSFRDDWWRGLNAYLMIATTTAIAAVYVAVVVFAVLMAVTFVVPTLTTVAAWHYARLAFLMLMALYAPYLLGRNWTSMDDAIRFQPPMPQPSPQDRQSP